MLNKFTKHIGNLFGCPDGIGGIFAAKIMNVMNQKQYKTVLKNVKLKPNDTILDIGFGNGYLIQKLFSQNIPITIYGIDISKDMLNKAASKNKHNIDNGKLKLFLEDIGKTSFEHSTFDKIYTVNTVYFWDEMEKCFSEIKRILKPDGIFMNLFYTKEFLDKIVYTKYGFNKYGIEEMERITKENGMEIVETIEIAKGKSYCVVARNLKAM